MYELPRYYSERSQIPKSTHDMIPSIHISNRLNESMVLEIRIVVTLVGPVITEKWFEGNL